MKTEIINKLIKGLKIKITKPDHPHFGEVCEVIEMSKIHGYLYVQGSVNAFTVLDVNDFEKDENQNSDLIEFAKEMIIKYPESPWIYEQANKAINETIKKATK